MLTEKWKTSTRSGDGGNCVEVRLAQGVQVRDSKDRTGAVLTFDPGAWTAFLRGGTTDPNAL